MRALALSFAAVAFTLAPLYAPSEARANGRFPKAQTIALPPGGDGATIYLRATFGVLVSRDAGKTWRWLCEQALGFSSTWDPPIAVTRDGRLWVALSDGARTTQGGCAVSAVPGIQGELVADLAVDGTGGRVFAVSSPPGKPAFVWRSPLAPSAAPSVALSRVGRGITGFRFDTIEVAPSNPARLYLTATPDGKGSRAHIFRSDDGGATVVELSPALPNDGRLFVSAVDPRDPDRVYVRQLAETGSDVLLSTDGAKTFTSVLHMKGAMFGFARTSDGSVVYAGGGDPAEGIWVSRDRGASWKAGAKTSVLCLNAEGPRLLVCSNPFTPGGYAVAESTDFGTTVRPLATFDDVLGPLDCDGAAGTTRDDAGGGCAASWPETRAAIATTAHLRPPAIDASVSGDAGAIVGGTAPRPARASSSCGCTAAGAPSPRALVALLLAVSLAAAAAARRARLWID